MRDSITMWGNTRMIVLTAASAALYACLLMPFKIMPIIPGFTEVRPGIAVPMAFSLLFGPAAAFGAAIGNLIGDIWGGMIGPTSVFGFLGNFLMGYIPYKFYHSLTGRRDIRFTGFGSIAALALSGLVASSACGVVIGWGVDLMGFVPLRILVKIIALNNSLFCIALGLPLAAVLYPRIKRWGLHHPDVLGVQPRRSIISLAGVGLMTAGSLGGVAATFLGVTNPTYTIYVAVILLAMFLL